MPYIDTANKESAQAKLAHMEKENRCLRAQVKGKYCSLYSHCIVFIKIQGLKHKKKLWPTMTMMTNMRAKRLWKRRLHSYHL